jgi:hypothetical protein
MGTKITSALASLPAKIAGIFKSVKEGAVAEATEMQDTLVTHSVFPEIAEGAIDAMFRMKGGVIENVTKMAAETTQKFEEMASTIADSDWGIDKKMSAFSQLRESMAKAGNVGTKAFSALEKTIQDTSRAAVSAKLDEIMNDVTLSLGEQIAQVKGVQTEWAKYGTAGSSANKEILATLQGLNAELANNQIDELLDDTTLSLEDQIAALDQSADYYSAMGADGKKALVQIEGASADLSKELKKNSSVLHGVGTAIEDNNRAWGGWGRSSERIVGAFAQNSEAALSNFFMTGKFNIQDFGAQMKQTFADEAAKFVVNFALQGIKSIVMWGASMFTSTTTATVGLHGTTTAAWGLNAAMAPMLLVVLAIAAALAILYFAGVDLGDLFKGLMSIVGSFGKLLFSGILVVVNLIVGAFKALVGLLETFVKWIKTIGDELGKGDLKDLFKIFGGGFGGIFKGIGSFFGGLFQEGGPIEGSGPVPIVAHGGEFVVNARSSDQYRPLLEAINDSQAPFRAFAAGGDMMLTRPTLLLGGEAGPESVSFTKGGRNANAGPVNINGPIISSDITMGQFARKLGVRMELEQRRKRGG